MRHLPCLLGALLVVGCGSTSTPGASGAGSSATPAPGGGSSSGGSLTVTGSLSVSVNETVNSANSCRTGSGGAISAILTFDAYSLQFSIPTGTTTFPSTGFGVAFFSNNDSSQEWAASAGTVTLSADGKSGTVDTDMSPHPPSPNPALKPIHVKGTFSCA